MNAVEADAGPLKAACIFDFLVKPKHAVGQAAAYVALSVVLSILGLVAGLAVARGMLT